jgi:hypothetical protein
VSVPCELRKEPVLADCGCDVDCTDDVVGAVGSIVKSSRSRIMWSDMSDYNGGGEKMTCLGNVEGWNE